MKKTLLLTVLIYILNSWAMGSISLTVDGQSYDAFPLKVGQEVLIEIRSSTIMPYSAYAGFDEGTDPLGIVSNPERFPLTSGPSSMDPVFSPPLYGYHIEKSSQGFGTGLHFRFTYTAQTPGQTLLKLYNHDMSFVRDSLILTVEPAETGTGFTYQGRLLDENAGANGLYDFMFLLYDTPSEGKRVADENILEDVEVLDGYFTVTLDFGDVFGGQARWLKTSVRPGGSTDDYTVLFPRQRITPAPQAVYAARAGYAEGVEWVNIADVPADIANYVAPDIGVGYLPYYDGAQLVNGPVRTDGLRTAVGTAPVSARMLNVSTDSLQIGIYSENTASSGIKYGIYGASTGHTTGGSYGLYGSSSSNAGDNYGVRGYAHVASSGTNYGIYGSAANSGAGEAYAGYFSGDLRTTGVLNRNHGLQIATNSGAEVAIGTSIHTGRKVNIYTTSNQHGLFSTNAKSTGWNYAIRGESTGDTTGSSYGLYGVSSSSAGSNYAVFGQANTASPGTNYGIYASAANSGTGGAYAGYFVGDVRTTGNHAIGTTLDTDRQLNIYINKGNYNLANYGIYSQNATGGSGNKYAIFGESTGGSTNHNYGVVGQSNGSAPATHIGVAGIAEGANSGLNYGVYGRGSNDGSGNAYAGYFSGRVHVGGALTKLSGFFKIDHPMDPENKYLTHSFVESPDMMNVYNGNIETDDEGFAVVELPEYFEALNRDFRYQLTVIGQFAQAIIAEKIHDNNFVIQTDKPHVEVSWQVTGIRQDAYAQANPIVVEEYKPAEERGRYLSPEAFGFGPERGVHFLD